MTKTTPTSLQSLSLSLPVIFFLLLFVTHAYSQLYDQEHAVLLQLQQHWQYPPSIDHWTQPNSSHCTWREVNCTDNSITGLSLIDKNITGTIPPFICDLKNLTVVDLQYNYIPGRFPTVLYNCSKLDYLDLSQNYFVGAIPDDIYRLPLLQFLNLGANNFSDDIPAAIGRLTELRTLHLYQNQFKGSFPPEIGNLSKLETLGMANNKFRPSRLPSNFTQLKKLKVLWMSETNLIGEIPEMIGDMAALELLDLSTNNLTGRIPNGVFMLQNLSQLYLYKNLLFGEIPRFVGALNLDVIDLSDNNLTGTIPDDFGKLLKLSGLALFFNQLSGEIPESIARIPKLLNFIVYSNNLSGIIPPDFGRYSMLVRLEVASNMLTGRLPEHLCYGGKLLGLIAFDNKLSGELPESLGNCSSLLMVRLSNNSFSGKIPGGLWTALNLTYLMVSDNMFTGELPDRLASNLSRLEISNNNFSGQIPAGVASWRSLVVFAASNNLFSGTIPRELTALPSLMTILLDQNRLSGSLPSGIISWKSLITLNLTRNQLSGQIPEALGLVPLLSSLDLSENQFSGQIPPQLGSVKFTVLNLSSNLLIGKIPSELDNSAFSNSFLNNSGLCADSPSLNLTVCNLRKSSKNSPLNPAFISIIVVGVFVLALLLSVFTRRVYWKRKHGLNLRWKLTSFQRLNFTERNILSKLTERNLIGSGGSGKVYRVTLNHPSDVVAVKKIWNNKKLDQKLEKEFLAEVQILSTIRHLNIVKLMCCISSDNSKLLVYEYLKNRSLDRWLHKKDRPSIVSGSVHHLALDWPKRLHIAVGAAQGLCYMHHDCLPTIIHRDIKSSNILLDSDFNAKIADFGLAKILINQGEIATMSVVAGSIGYMAPEYAHTTRVNEKIDVYSFGVVLLELTTGREAHDGDKYTCLAERAWRHIQEDKPIVDALDEEIKEPCYMDQMSNVFKLGIICTCPQPSARPSMKDVVQILLRSSHPNIWGEKIATIEYDGAPLLKNSKSERMSEIDDPSLASEV